jgi:hypothetical protein
MRRSRRKFKIPNKMFSIPNNDKTWHEKWSTKRNMLNIPHPFRALCLGPPNCGKSSAIQHLLLRAKPTFKEVIVIHCDPEFTKEYDDLGDQVQLTDEIPHPTDFVGEEKTLVVIDDIEVKRLSKEQMARLDRLFGFVSTHKNISIIMTAQNAFDIPPIVRRCTNLWILWKIDDIESLQMLVRKTGIKKALFDKLFDLCENKHDSIWIDKTEGSPYPLRFNGFEVIEKVLTEE